MTPLHSSNQIPPTRSNIYWILSTRKSNSHTNMNSQTPSLSLMSSLKDQTTVLFRQVFIANKRTPMCTSIGMHTHLRHGRSQQSEAWSNDHSLSHQQKQRWVTSYPTCKKYSSTFNNYPNKAVDNIINTERTQTVTTLNEEDQPLKNNETVTLTLPYAGQKGELMVKKTVTDALNKPNNKV